MAISTACCTEKQHGKCALYEITSTVVENKNNIKTIQSLSAEMDRDVDSTGIKMNIDYWVLKDSL